MANLSLFNDFSNHLTTNLTHSSPPNTSSLYIVLQKIVAPMSYSNPSPYGKTCPLQASVMLMLPPCT